MTWLEQFNDNYYGRSPQAKELQEFLSKNYNGSSYISWAVMERMIYQQDENATFEVIRSTPDESFALSATHNANFVFSDIVEIKTKATTEAKSSETLAQSIAHFVVVRLTFLGKTFEEVYPVQDNKYSAPKVIDQNLVNKAIQRAKAKVASRASGLAYTLYETGDLQFEDDNISQVTAPKPIKAVKEESVNLTSVKSEPTQVEKIMTGTNEHPDVKYNAEITQAAGEIRGNIEAFTIGCQKINQATLKRYGFTLSPSDADLEEKLSKVENLTVFMRTLKTQSGLPV